MRIITPLGREAVTLIDSNGKALKHASKGFVNHFTNIKIEGHDDVSSQGGVEDDTIMSPSNASHLASTSLTEGDEGKTAEAAVADGVGAPASPEAIEQQQLQQRGSWSTPKSRREGRSRGGRSAKGSSGKKASRSSTLLIAL